MLKKAFPIQIEQTERSDTTLNIDAFVKSRFFFFFQSSRTSETRSGIQWFQRLLDPGLRRGDGLWDFLRSHQR